MVSILLMSIGITFIIIGIMVFIDKIRLLKSGIKTEGEVIDFQKGLSSYIGEDKQIVYVTVYRPVIRFKDENNEVKIITYDLSESERIYNIGDKVNLVYTRNDPDYVEIAEKQIIFSMLCKLISIGIMFIIFSIILCMV
ncbi:DUF3592 domain-containing protein [uncultured Clostridium sp.]|uniref:DUF3592 domain-containing protein n=1 Tax=uncultured Clostridium sp. TaxID=59620 RepID=UPI0025DE3EDD|nr:DUF3592 domain-containing protein [uncultured Clostridium sp.]